MNKWDRYFFNIAYGVANNSKCMSRKIGAVIAKDKYIISTGYNGAPRGCKDCCEKEEFPPTTEGRGYVLCFHFYKQCPRKQLGFQSGEGLHLCPAAHAEMNAIAIAAKLGHSVEGCSLYLNTFCLPCRECAKVIINAGIVEVVSFSEEAYEKEGVTGKDLLIEAGVFLRKYEEKKI